jgi:amino acid transporter
MSDATLDALPSEERGMVAQTDLKAGALGLPSVVMQGITTIAPAIAILYSFQFIVGLAGVAAPWVYIAASAIVIMTAVSLVALARAFPSAGSYFTYVSRTVHPRAGFLAGWMYILYAPPVSGTILCFMGFVIETEINANYSVDIKWYWWALGGGIIVAFMTYTGVEMSGRALMLFGGAEVVLVLLLSVWGFFETGPGGFSFAPLNPGNATSLNGFYLAVVFSIFAYTGWEGVAPIAEESENPRRNVPLGIYISIAVLGVMFIICFWGLLNGWGVNDLVGLGNSSELPPFVLAHRFWGGAWILVLLALANSTLAVSIACTNISTRIWYKMGRSGALPKQLGYVHPKYKTPWNALHLQMLFFLVVAFVVGHVLGPDTIWFWFGFVITLSVVVIYSLANVGNFLYHWREKRQSFNWIIHFLFPLLSTAALIWLVYKTVNPYPADPFKWTIWTVLGWLVIGILIIVFMAIRGNEQWLAKAADSVEERPETAEEKAAHVPGL